MQAAVIVGVSDKLLKLTVPLVNVSAAVELIITVDVPALNVAPLLVTAILLAPATAPLIVIVELLAVNVPLVSVITPVNVRFRSVNPESWVVKIPLVKMKSPAGDKFAVGIRKVS